MLDLFPSKAAMVHEGYLLAGWFQSLCLYLQAAIFQEWSNYSVVLCIGNKPFEVPPQEHYLCA